MSNLSKRNLKGGKSSRKRVQSHKRRSQRGGALDNREYAELLDLVLQLTKPGNNNPDPDNNQLNVLLQRCSLEQLNTIISVLTQTINNGNTQLISVLIKNIYSLITQNIQNK